MTIFKDKVLLITGGTDSFDNVVSHRLLDSDACERLLCEALPVDWIVKTGKPYVPYTDYVKRTVWNE